MKKLSHNNLYLGIIIVAAILSVFLLGATYGKDIKLQSFLGATPTPVGGVETYPSGGIGACVWGRPPLPCDIKNGTNCSTKLVPACQNNLTVAECTAAAAPSLSSFYPGSTCAKQGINPQGPA